MIRSENARVTFLDANGQTVQMVELFGSSSDTKPTEGICNGSSFLEVDTGDIYLWNESASEWVKQFSLQG